MAMESIMLSSVPMTIKCQKQRNAQVKVDDADTLCEPIRKQCVTISPGIEVSTNQMVCFQCEILYFVTFES